MKKFLTVLFSCTALVLSACNFSSNSESNSSNVDVSNTSTSTESPEMKLDKPKILNVLSNNVYWEEVANASSYVVKILGYSEVNVGSQLNFDIPSFIDDKIEESTPTPLRINVMAKDDQHIFEDSDWSDTFLYEYVKGHKEEVPDTPKGEPYVESGVGHAIDVVTATNYNDFKMGVDVLDNTKLKTADYRQKENRKSNIEANSYRTIEEVYRGCSLSYDINNSYEFGMNIFMFGFLATYSVNFKTSSSLKTEDIKDSYYYVLSHYINRYTLSLANYAEDGYYIDYLSDTYLNALKNLGNAPTKDDFYSFFAKYGTHIIASGIYGGRLNAYYDIFDKTQSFSTETSDFLKNTVGAKIYANVMNFGASVGAETSVATEVKNHFEKINHSIETNFKLENCGGNSVSSLSLDDLGQAVQTWSDSFNNDDTNSVLIGFENDGLIALWDLLPKEYSHLKDGMMDAFSQYYKENYANCIKDFKYNDTVSFAGGSGTPADPYLIETPQQLANINNNLDANYKITKDIDLGGYSNWNAIGGHYKDDSTLFTGHLDGGNHKIKNLKRTEEIAEFESRIYFGLFGRIGKKGIVKDLIFENVNVNVKGPNVNNSQTKVFFGVLAGVVYGEVSNVKVNSGTFIYDCCTNGSSYVGSIAGSAVGATIKDCENKASLTSGRYGGSVGGMAGFASGANFYTCVNNGSLTAYCTGFQGAAFAGGIVGEGNQNKDCTFYECINNGKLKADCYSWSIIGWTTNTNDEMAHKVAGVFE